VATKIRLRRLGAKKAPFYRMVVADTHAPRDGKFIEEIGYYDPTTQPTTLNIKEDRAKEWLSTGVQLSDRVRILFQRAGLL